MTDDELERVLAQRSMGYWRNRAVIDVKRVLPALRAEGFEVLRQGEVPPWMEKFRRSGIIDGYKLKDEAEGE